MMRRLFNLHRHFSTPKPFQQEHFLEPDRNLEKGGRSFYFFDFDDNLAFLTTPAVLFHKQTGEELFISCTEFTQSINSIGLDGKFADYEIDYDEELGSFRFYRDTDINFLEWLRGRRQRFIEDIAHALGFPEFRWKGPSWQCFLHATVNRRPTALITARGHHPRTIRDGFSLFVKNGHIPWGPNFLSILPVNYPPLREQLILESGAKTTAELKKVAIRTAVDEALAQYGYGPHQFGMSDDDPRNLHVIEEQMHALKRQHSRMSFFVISTHGKELRKREIL